jgi:hypothetical protein
VSLEKEQMLQLLSAYLDDEVSSEERVQAEQLLADSAAAREIFEQLSATKNLFATIEKVEPPPYLHARIASGITKQRRDSFKARIKNIFAPRRLQLPILTYASALIIIVSAIFIFRATIVEDFPGIVNLLEPAAEEEIYFFDEAEELAAAPVLKQEEPLDMAEAEEVIARPAARESRTVESTKSAAPRMAKSSADESGPSGVSAMLAEAVDDSEFQLISDEKQFFSVEPAYYRVDVVETMFVEKEGDYSNDSADQIEPVIPSFEFLMQGSEHPLDPITLFAEMEYTTDGKVIDIEVSGAEEHSEIIAIFKRHMLKRRLAPEFNGGKPLEIKLYIAVTIYRTGMLAD